MRYYIHIMIDDVNIELRLTVEALPILSLPILLYARVYHLGNCLTIVQYFWDDNNNKGYDVNVLCIGYGIYSGGHSRCHPMIT